MSYNITSRSIPRPIKATHSNTIASTVLATVTAFNYAGHTAHYFKGLSGAPTLVSNSDQTEPETGSDTDTSTDTHGQHHFKSTTQQKQAEVKEEIKVTAVVAQLVKSKKQKGTINTSKTVIK